MLLTIDFISDFLTMNKNTIIGLKLQWLLHHQNEFLSSFYDVSWLLVVAFPNCLLDGVGA